MPEFKLKSDYQPAGGQPEAIEKLVQGLRLGMEEQTMLGVTGAGKTFVMANVIQQMQRPTLVLTHNKTLSALAPFMQMTSTVESSGVSQ